MSDIVPIEKITSKIYIIRDTRIMLDRDLAELYGVKTKALKQAVRRNIARFPEDFMFELTKEEFRNWRSQFVTSNQDKMGLRYRPMAFIEQGVAMLSSILKSERAIGVNVAIMRAFVQLREISKKAAGLLVARWLWVEASFSDIPPAPTFRRGREERWKNQTPENWTLSKRREGQRTEELKKASLPISTNLFQKFRWLPARFISAIGLEGLPFSIHKPRTPIEKSPVAELELPPEKPVMRIPLSMVLSRPSRSLSP